MDTLTRPRTQSLILGGVALGALLLVGFAIMASSGFGPDRIAFGVALALTVAATSVAWWFACKRARMPTWVAVAAFGWGAMVARLWVPYAPVSLLVGMGGVAEAITVGWAVLRLRRVVRMRSARDQDPSTSR
jgi:hypothetical protein